MAKTINTRIQNKFATWAEWQPVWQTFIPLKGEVCKVQIPANTPESITGVTNSPDVQVFTKTGDGVTLISQLPWDGAMSRVVTGRQLTQTQQLNFGESFEAVSDVSGGSVVYTHPKKFTLPDILVKTELPYAVEGYYPLTDGFTIKEEFCEAFEGARGTLKENYVVIRVWEDSVKDLTYMNGDAIDTYGRYLEWESNSTGNLILVESLAAEDDSEEYTPQTYYYCGIRNYDGKDYDLWARVEEKDSYSDAGYSTLYTERITNNQFVKAKTYSELNKYFASNISVDGNTITAYFNKESDITVSTKRTPPIRVASHGEIVELVSDIVPQDGHSIRKDSVKLKLPEETTLTVNTNSFLHFNDSIYASDGLFHSPVPVVYVETIDSDVYSDGAYAPVGREFIAYEKINNGITLYKLHRETGEAEYDFPFEYSGEAIIDGAILDRWCCTTDPQFSTLYYYTDKIVEYKDSETITPEPGEEIDVITNIEVGQTSHSIDVKRAKITLPVVEDGYTPVKGVDYFTPADQAEFVDFITTEIAKRKQLKPEFANTIEECVDISRLYVLPDGMIYAYMFVEKEIGGYTNLVDLSDMDNTSNPLGFKTKSRLNANAAVSSCTVEGAFVANVFDCKPNDILRIKGVTGTDSSTSTAPGFVVSRLKEDGSNVTNANNMAFLKEHTGVATTAVQQCWDAYTTDENGVITWTFAMNNSGANFAALQGQGETVKARIAGIATDGIENVIVTVNEEIKPATIVKEYAWTNTGREFIPADYEDRIIALEDSVEALEAKVENINVNGGSGTVAPKTDVNWYAFGDSITQGYVSYIKEDGTASSRYSPAGKHSWAYKVAELNGYNLTNYAVGGTGLAYGNPNAPSTAREQVDAVDFTDCDLVTLAWGCNDWKYNGGAVGTAEDDKDNGTTPMAALKYVIEKIQSQNPLCKIIVITPINVCFWGTFEGNYGLSHSFSKTGTLQQFYDAIVSVCEYYGIEYIDNTHSSIFNRVNITNLLLDGVHPTPEAYQVMAKELAKKINFK